MVMTLFVILLWQEEDGSANKQATNNNMTTNKQQSTTCRGGDRRHWTTNILGNGGYGGCGCDRAEEMVENRKCMEAMGEKNGWQSRSLGQMMREKTGTVEAEHKGRKLCGR
jgi:hypothetical protein